MQEKVGGKRREVDDKERRKIGKEEKNEKGFRGKGKEIYTYRWR